MSASVHGPLCLRCVCRASVGAGDNGDNTLPNTCAGVFCVGVAVSCRLVSVESRLQVVSPCCTQYWPGITLMYLFVAVVILRLWLPLIDLRLRRPFLLDFTAGVSAACFVLFDARI